MKTTALYALLVFSMFVAAKVKGQGAVKDLEKYLATVKKNPSVPIPSSVLLDFKSEKALIMQLLAHRSEGNEEFQFHVLDLMSLIAIKSKNSEVRKSVVSHFTQTIPDKNLRIGGFASTAVMRFLPADFSQSNKDSIQSYLRSRTANLDGLFRLAGYLEIVSVKEKITSMLSEPMSPTLKWHARLALARLGDEDAISFIIEKITTSAIDDSFISSVIPGLVYTRNKKIFKELEKILMSDASHCRSSYPDSKATILCAYRVLESMAIAIEKFPIKVDESGDLLVDNYESALDTARRWLKQNPDYKIERNTM